MWPGLPFGHSVELPGLFFSRDLPSSPESLLPFLSSPHAGLLLAVCQALENSTSAQSGESCPLWGMVWEYWMGTDLAGRWSLPSKLPVGSCPFCSRRAVPYPLGALHARGLVELLRGLRCRSGGTGGRSPPLRLAISQLCSDSPCGQGCWRAPDQPKCSSSLSSASVEEPRFLKPVSASAW